ncbi:sensory box/GGDEF family protein [Neokomagataea thailandica NBRC 106555]|uniref:EAL domain-containing protein n=2 Tax=Neokomagataea TaxID=1223423 RepID=A0A4Y6V3M2_9PROT|nr:MULTISPECIES: GGDEF domain-containing phosphodiesterase [Neokomagataea]QDH23964.1 EAL domain-containing protein [Neokomagataea tanensis]GBR54584.1 sensory box/GGDEF family protein [Neokomagataea thailandica NBRC 106555]
MSINTQKEAALIQSILNIVSRIVGTHNCALVRASCDTFPTHIVTHKDANSAFTRQLQTISFEQDIPQLSTDVHVHTLSETHSIYLIIRTADGSALTRDMSSSLQELQVIAETTLPPRQVILSNRPDSLLAITKQIELISYQKRKSHFGTILFAVDQLRQINQHYGWDLADKVLNAIARRVQNILPENSVLGNFGGGQFIVVTPPGTSSTNTQSLINALQSLTAECIVLNDHNIGFTFSIGWGLYPHDGSSADELILATTAALTNAQQSGRGHITRSSLHYTEHYRLAQTLEKDLSSATTDEALFLRWMPIIDLATQKIIGQEALLRWNRPQFGEISPTIFIQSAEKNGLIEQLDQWALHEACSVASKWAHPHRVCVNISPTWVGNERLPHIVEKVLNDTGLAPERLQIELSERIPFTPDHVICRELTRLRGLGVRIAIDDFGSGTSSLERLRTYPIDQLKLDRVFVERLYEDDRANATMRCILKMAQMLGFSICAKGVETEKQLSFLDGHGCPEAQGFLFGQPALLS